MARTSASFNRKPSRLKPQPTVLVICEDKKSSRNYLQDACAYFRITVKVLCEHYGVTDPKNIVEAGIKNQGRFDEIWCTIDRDDHQNFPEAVELAKRFRKINLIVSYPCFEYWLLLHYVYNRRPYTSAGGNSAADRLIRDLREHEGMENYEKGTRENLFMRLLAEGRFEDARKRAVTALNDAKDLDEYNPSTTLHELLNRFEELSESAQ